MKFEKLFSLHAVVDFIEEMQSYGIPGLRINLAEFLEKYKKN